MFLCRNGHVFDGGELFQTLPGCKEMYGKYLLFSSSDLKFVMSETHSAPRISEKGVWTPNGVKYNGKGCPCKPGLVN